ncbi:MAG: hypothetical protein AB8B69_01015, partial [Chitinophagales bacterium]
MHKTNVEHLLLCENKAIFIPKIPTTIKQLPQNIAALQIAEQLELDVKDYERKHLPKNESFIIIVNPLPDNLEILAVQKLLKDFEGEREIISL